VAAGLIPTIALIVLTSGILGGGSSLSDVTGAGGPESPRFVLRWVDGKFPFERPRRPPIAWVSADSVQAFWETRSSSRAPTYQKATTVPFTDQVDTGCGDRRDDGSSAKGYSVPRPGFFDELRTQLGATGGPSLRGYVVGHEYGHHICGPARQLGGWQHGRQQPVREDGALQADCYAGV